MIKWHHHGAYLKHEHHYSTCKMWTRPWSLFSQAGWSGKVTILYNNNEFKVQYFTQYPDVIILQVALQQHTLTRRWATKAPGITAIITKIILLRMSQAAYQRRGVRIPFDRASLRCIVRCRKRGKEVEGEGRRETVWS